MNDNDEIFIQKIKNELENQGFSKGEFTDIFGLTKAEIITLLNIIEKRLHIK